MIKIGFAEKDEDLRGLLKICFKVEGFQVVEIPNEEVLKRNFDQLDLLLFEPYGFGVKDYLSIIREGVSKGIPVALLTVKVGKTDTEEYKRVGVPYFEKPFNSNILLGQVKEMMGGDGPFGYALPAEAGK